MVKNQESFTMKKEPVRIIHVLAGMVRAGTETMLMNLYRNIDRAKVQFDFAVCATKECDYDEEILYLGGRIFHYPQYLGKNHFAYKSGGNNSLQLMKNIKLCTDI